MVINHIIALLAIVVCCHGLLSVDTNANVLRDEYNRVRVFHGVNVVYK
jgi:hypothetical protein